MIHLNYIQFIQERADMEFYDKNILYLSAKNEYLSTILKNSPTILPEVQSSKDGLLIPSFQDERATRHSKYSTIKETSRIADQAAGYGYVVVFGLAAGHHIREILSRSGLFQLVIFETSLQKVKGLLHSFDYSDIFSDLRVQLFVDADEEIVAEYVRSTFLPALHKNFTIAYLQASMNLNKSYFSHIINTLDVLTKEILDDYLVQSHFANQWFSNSIHNLKAAETDDTVLRGAKKICIIGAGPSLERQLDTIVHIQSSGGTLISSDTALPGLLAQGIQPEIVLSIDCQHVSYHHLLVSNRKALSNILFVFDLASPRSLTKPIERTIFFTSGHPFSQYIAQHHRRYPQLDTSGGNVSHTALSLASELGASEIYIAGQDFSYPNRKGYTKGSYLYPFFEHTSNKLFPIERKWWDFLSTQEPYPLRTEDDFTVYSTLKLETYQRAFYQRVQDLSASVYRIDSQGKAMLLHSGSKAFNNPVFFSAGPVIRNLNTVLNNLLTGLKAFQFRTEHRNPLEFLFHLQPGEIEMFKTILPTLAFYRRRNPEMEIQDLLEIAFTSTISSIEKHIIHS
jgi:hypothetical protein